MSTKTLEQEIKDDAPKVSEDKLDRVRTAVRAARDLRLQIADLQEQVKVKNIELHELIHKRLPDVFLQSGVRYIGLDREGNLPAYRADLCDYYYANIAGGWEEERQERAFDLLEKTGRGDLVKRTIVVKFGLREEKLFSQVYKKLSSIKGLKMVIKRFVPWNTLTAMIKETYESGEQLGSDELYTLGATVGQIVNIKEIVEK